MWSVLTWVKVWHTSSVDLGPILAILAAAGGGLAASLLGWLSNWWSSRAESKERDRLSNEVFGTALPRIADLLALEETAPEAASRIIELADAGSAREALTKEEVPGPEYPSPAAEFRVEKLFAESETTYDKLLINDYALGLTQARRAFNVSTMFSILGGVVLIAGVSLAIFRADTGGQVAGAVITSSAGVLTSGLSQLFRGQSAKALKHLETQAAELRKDVRVQSNTSKALKLLDEVDDDDLRARLQAALILQFTNATLPDLESHSSTRSGLNGMRANKQESLPTD